MVSGCKTSVDTLSEGSDIELETVETSDLEELEDDDYLPLPRDQSLRAQSPMSGVTASMEGQGKLLQTVIIVNLILLVLINNGHLTLNNLTEGLEMHTIPIQGPIQHFLMRPKQLIISKNFGIKL